MNREVHHPMMYIIGQVNFVWCQACQGTLR